MESRNDTPRFDRDTGTSIAAGSLLGVVTWALGYGLTYLLVAPEVRASPLHRFIEAFDGEPATYELVGWVFYNAHLTDTVIRNVPIVGSRTLSFVGGEGGFAAGLYAIPIGVLLGAGLALAGYRGADGPRRGARDGLLVLPGYLLISVAGVFLFTVTLGGARGAPDLLPAILLAGIAYPVLFAGAGGALGGYFIGRVRNKRIERTG